MTIVILGGGVNNNKLPDQVKKRLDKAIKISKNRDFDRFLVCGKYSFLFSEDEAPSVTEAKIMKDYLVSKGIKEKNIFLEEKSMDTISNAYYAKTEYFLPEDENESLIITSNYHLPRVKYIFKKMFGDEYKLEFEGVEAQASKKLINRQKELLAKFKEITKNMKSGDHEFFKGKFFNIKYYKEKREDWVKNITAKGNE